MNLRFPELRGGTYQGLNDAGVENYQGAIDVYVSRECGQNTADAHRPGVATVRLEFDRIAMRADAIPCFDQLRLTLAACLAKSGGKEKEREFFEQAVGLAGKDEISVLKISDYGTTGLTGGDGDEKGRWFALVKSQGVSNKEDIAGGSFGIGKSSPFAASRFRSVFYGTRTESGTVALQGVSRLVTHRNADGKLTQGTGFIGEYDPQGGEDGEPVFRAIRDEGRIPLAFRRGEPGTDIWVIGYRSGPEWSGDLIQSILSNFWPAIHRGTIQFRVGTTIVSKETLGELIEKYIGHEDFEAHHYYRAISSQPIKKTLSHTGSCELYLTAASPDLPRAICMVRNTGMRIYDYQPRACRVPFSGLFICTDHNGNKLLRKLEPPKHDTWDPKRIEDQGGKKALDEIKMWIRDEVKKLNPLFAGSSFNESELAKYLADTTPEDANDLPNDGSGQSQEESLEPKTTPDAPPAQSVPARPIAATADGTAENGGGRGKQTGGKGGNGEGGRDRGNPKGGGAKDDPDPPAFQVRTYRSGIDQYELVLRSEAAFTGAVCVSAVGEDGQRERVELRSARLAGLPGTALHVREDAIEGVQLDASVPLRITLKLNALERRSLTAGPRT